jgi:peptidoglycan/xylan/chitin deacetylase (PgdA/CDA1 family)
MLLDACRAPLLDLYYLATLPQRRQSAAQWESDHKAPITVLFYHRVADSEPNDWTIPTEQFRRQISWVKDRLDVVTLEEAQRRIAAQGNDRPAVSITFDDGYADNCATALPWLLKNNVPFTYFVTTNHIQSGEPFAHDVAAGRPLPPNTVEQIRALAASGAEIGAHSRSHADLGRLADKQALHDEIVGSKRDLEAIIDRSVRYFAFPFGRPENLSNEAIRVAFHAGLRGVCSAYGGYNLPGDDPFHVQRIHGDPEWARFRNWLTFDPRKLRQPKQFCPGDYRSGF